MQYKWSGSKRASSNPIKEEKTKMNQGHRHRHTHTQFFILELFTNLMSMHPQRIFQSQNMLAWPDALKHVRWTGAGISGAGWCEMNNVLVMGNRGRRNGVSVFGARNAQRISTFVADVPGYSNISLLNCNDGRVPLHPFWHREEEAFLWARPFFYINQ